MNKLTIAFISMICMILCGEEVSAQKWSVGVNAADMLDLMTIDIEGSYAPIDHLTINLGAEVNPWIFNKGKSNQIQNRKQTYNAGVRYWWNKVYSGWWTGAGIQYREYNHGGIIGNETEEGDSYGIELNGGYSLTLAEHFNMEFGLGLWGGYKTYTAYACPQCGKVTDSGNKWFLMPNDLIIGLVWTF